jgi:hypothetical protein
MNYTVIEASEVSTLMKKVNGMIELKIGWRCVGGLTAIRPRVSGPIVFLQAMENSGGAEPKAAPGLGMKIRDYGYQPSAKYQKSKLKRNDRSETD